MEPGKTRETKDLFTLVERNDKTFYLKSGKAFLNADDSWTLLLDTLPVSGKMQMRTPRPYQERGVAPEALLGETR